MKIWVVGRDYPTVENGMWGLFELEQAKMLAKCGNEVTFLALTLSFVSRGDVRGMRRFEDEGVMVYAYSHLYFPGKTGIHVESFENRCWHALFGAAAEEGGLPSIVHVHYPAMIADVEESEWLRKNGVRLFATEHWSRVLIGRLSSIERRRLSYFAERSSCMACVSSLLEGAMRREVRVSVPTRVIPNVVSPVFFGTDCFSSQQKIRFIAVGKLIPIKRFDAVIQGFLDVFGEDERAELVIVGNGKERRRLVKVAKGNGRVALRGGLPLGGVAREMSRASVLVSFSKYETFAVPVAEAWACGRPAIVSDASGIANCMTENLGLVVSASAQEDLAYAMRAIVNRIDSYNPNEIRQYAFDHYSNAEIARQLQEMYESFS